MQISFFIERSLYFFILKYFFSVNVFIFYKNVYNIKNVVYNSNCRQNEIALKMEESKNEKNWFCRIRNYGKSNV